MLFRRFCDQALQDPSLPYVLIIDKGLDNRLQCAT
jgi:hypothetical protein